MTADPETPIAPSRWLHRWALLTVAVTLGLLALGSVVTTFRVGMADPVWPTYPWHLLLIDWQEPRTGFLIEHAHRLAGYVVGLCALALAIGLWLHEQRGRVRGPVLAAQVGLLIGYGLIPGAGFGLVKQLGQANEGWARAAAFGLIAGNVLVLAVALALAWRGDRRRWLGVAALAGVVVQGMFGGFRVWLNALLGTGLAVTHGCFAQVVFALLVGLAVSLSPRWNALPREGDGADRRVRRWALVTAGLVYLQIVFGAILRHTYSSLGQRGHLLVAFGVVAAVVGLVRLVFEDRVRDRTLTRAVVLLGALVTVQVLVGVEAWLGAFAAGTLPELRPLTVPQALIRTLHVLVGFGIFATSVVVALRAHRPSARAVDFAGAGAGRLKGVA